MNKLRLLLPLLLLLFVIPMTGQEEHAPTAAQCQADANVWGIPDVAPFLAIAHMNEFLQMNLNRVSAKTLETRTIELNECTKTDNTNAVKYSMAALSYVLAREGRTARFLQRHNLSPQFYAEDEQGMR